MISCKHQRDGLCKPCSEAKPYYQFRICKRQCFACNECGYFYGSGAPEALQGKPVVFMSQEPKKELYTADRVKESLNPKWDDYYAKLAVGQPPNWKCDETTKQNFCLTQWMIDECKSLGCSPDDTHNLLRGFNRNARSSYDLYQTMADVMNTYVNGDIVNYDGMRRH